MTLAAALTLTSCDDFLDKMPDNRTEINTADKVTKLLVSAYSESNTNYLCEMASDNTMDNGSNYTIGERQQQEAYLWKKITGTGNDSPLSFGTIPIWLLHRLIRRLPRLKRWEAARR